MKFCDIRHKPLGKRRKHYWRCEELQIANSYASGSWGLDQTAWRYELDWHTGTDKPRQEFTAPPQFSKDAIILVKRP